MRSIAIITLIVLAGVVTAMSVCQPLLLSQNSFLKNFINHELLNTMAVVVTITIATIATIHIWFNELEQKHDKKVFGPARREINGSASWLVGFFTATLVMLIVRSYFEDSNMALSFFNGFGVMLLIATIFVLMDILGVVRSLTPGE